MKPLPDLCLFGIRLAAHTRVMVNSARFAILVICLSAMASGVSAQTVAWSDSFVSGQRPTAAQCQSWTNFLNQLAGKNFSSVTFSGSNNPAGKTISDPAVATALAVLLSTKMAGSVISESNDTWAVIPCGPGGCGGASISLSVNGNGGCNCADTYTVRPHATNGNWGGINTTSCIAPSQSMTLEFNSGVYITPNGSTTLCEGDELELAAQSTVCSGPYLYEWSNGATEQSIKVSEPGDYFVTVSNLDGTCSATSNSISVSLSDISVLAGNDVTVCEEDVQLEALGSSGIPSGPTTNKFCIYDALGGNCNFTDDICVDKSERFGNTVFSQTVNINNPGELNFKLYYSPTSTSPITFILKLNGQALDTFVETLYTGACKPSAHYPRTFSFDLNEFGPYWSQDAANNIEVEIQSIEENVLVAGVVAEVTSLNEFYSWTPEDGLSNASIRNPLAKPDVTTIYTVLYTDANGCTATDEVEVTVFCVDAPIAVCQDLTVPAGMGCEAAVEAIEFNGGSTSPLGLDLKYSVSPAGPYPVGTTDVILKVTDTNLKFTTCTAKVTVINQTPEINEVVASPLTAGTNTPVTLTTTYTDDNVNAATIDWGDSSSPETVTDPGTTFEVSHTYSSSGSYTATITLTDACGSTTYVYETIVVANNSIGSVSGGGWYDSPRGAYLLKRSASGKATFAFQASNSSMNPEPEGYIVFNFKDGKIKFRSSDVEWLSLEDETARMKATGRMNGAQDYQILISMVEDTKHKNAGESGKGKKNKDDKGKKSLDLIRVKIWDPSGEVIYDTQFGSPDEAIATTPLGGGSINVDKKKSTFKDKYESPVATSFGGESSSVYPNPFNDWLDVKFNSASSENVIIQMLDLSGKVVYNEVFEASEDGNYSLDIPENEKRRPGIYILLIRQGKKVEFLRLVRE